MERNTILHGDSLEVLRTLPDESINCCITSPPYWGLRDYGVDGQLGLEKTPEEFISKLVDVFREVRRILRDDGTCWVNLGDSYASQPAGNKEFSHGKIFDGRDMTGHQTSGGIDKIKASGLKPKDLVGIPWMFAFAARKDGWYLRQDIIWHKPNPMPESVTDRCTKSHEYIFLLTKSAKYWYDHEAIKEEANYDGRNDTVMKASGKYESGEFLPDKNANGVHSRGHERWPMKDENGNPMRNKRSVWSVPTHPYSESHFATFPEKLIEPCVLAGCPKEVCPKCGKARARIVDTPKPPREVYTNTHKPDDIAAVSNPEDGKVGFGQKFQNWRNENPPITVGWSDCGCGDGFVSGLILDPFFGAGTTGLVAYKNNRDYLGIELNPKYIDIAKKRIAEETEQYALLETR